MRRPPPHLSLLFLFLLIFLPSLSSAQWPPPDRDALLTLQAALEYPPALSSWKHYSPFCTLAWTSSFSLTCSKDGRVTALSVTGSRTQPSSNGGPRDTLSGNFTISSLFSALAALPALTDLSLVSLGIWGSLPSDVAKLQSLRTLNLTGNYIYDELPAEMSTMKSLETLSLAGNLVKGSIPPGLLQGMSALRVLDLGGNKLGPDLPVPGPSVVTLILRNNSFKAMLPDGYRALTRLETLDVSGNKLFGSIPTFLFALPSVRHLDFSGNRFTGEIPGNFTACGRQLQYVDLSDNKLYGRLPACVVTAGANVPQMYSGNCLTGVQKGSQNPITYCGSPQEPLAVMPTPKGKRGGSSSNSSSSSSKSRALVLVAGIAGGIVGAVMVLTLLLLVVFKKAKARERETFALVKSVSGGTAAPAKVIPGHVADARHMAPEVRLGMLDLMPYRVFTMEEIDDMTSGFDSSNLVLDNPPDKIYRGWLKNGSAVTIRSFRLRQKYSPQILHLYMDTISKLRHRHLVSVLGHCIDVDHQENANTTTTTIYMVFEEVTNGTLRSHLTEWRKREMLKWPQRVAAVVGVARGIQFLHTVTSPGIFGNDLSMQNVMVNETLTAKITNFRLPTLPKNKNKVTSDAPFSQLEEKEVNSSVANLDKVDVYQLGLILLEVITGKTASSETELSVLKQQLQSIMPENDPGKLQELTDPSIRGTFAPESLKTAVEITLNCLSQEQSQRPSIDDVLWNLQYSVQVQDACASSDNLSTQS